MILIEKALSMIFNREKHCQLFYLLQKDTFEFYNEKQFVIHIE